MTPPVHRITVVAFAALALVAPAGAQQGAAPAVEPGFELAALLERALADSPDLAAARARLEAARSAARGAGALEDPTLGVEARWILPAGERDPLEGLLTIDQPLPGRGRRAAARAVAAAAVARAEIEVGRLEQRLLADVRVAFAEIYALDREIRALSEAHELLDLMVATASALYGSGEGSIGDAIEPQAELSLHDLELEAAEARMRAAGARLSARIGSGSPEAWPRVSGLPAVVLPKIDPATAAPVALPAVVATADERVAAARLEAARAARAVPWSVGAGTIWMDGRDPNLVARLGVGLPVFRKSRAEPAIAAAQAALEAARADRRARELEARAELAARLAEGRRLEKAIRRYAEGLLPQRTVLLDAARVELLSGRGAFSRSLERVEEWLAARIELARAEAGLFVAWSEIEALLASPVPAEGSSR
jgi:outer membrane protein TolC